MKPISQLSAVGCLFFLCIFIVGVSVLVPGVVSSLPPSIYLVLGFSSLLFWFYVIREDIISKDSRQAANRPTKVKDPTLNLKLAAATVVLLVGAKITSNLIKLPKRASKDFAKVVGPVESFYHHVSTYLTVTRIFTIFYMVVGLAWLVSFGINYRQFDRPESAPPGGTSPSKHHNHEASNTPRSKPRPSRPKGRAHAPRRRKRRR
jgi:hypothetical protein